MPDQVIETLQGKLIPLDQSRMEDLDFCRQGFGFEAQGRGWFRERDRILFRRALRRRVSSQTQSDQILERMRQAFKSGDQQFEQDLVNDMTKRGLFYGPVRIASGGCRYLEG